MVEVGSDRWWWLGRPLSLDLANYMHREGDSERFRDLLTSPDDLQSWLAAQGARVGEFEPDAHETRLADFVRLRDALRDLFTAISRGEEPTAQVVDVVNQYAAAAAVVPRLRSGPDGIEAVEEVDADPPSTAVLAAIARSAIDVVAGERQAVRVCGGSGCGAVFLASRPRQQWCSHACGNRARVARHAAKKRDAPG